MADEWLELAKVQRIAIGTGAQGRTLYYRGDRDRDRDAAGAGAGAGGPQPHASLASAAVQLARFYTRVLASLAARQAQANEVPLPVALATNLKKYPLRLPTVYRRV